MTEPVTAVVAAPAVVAVATKAPAEISFAGEAMLWLGIVILLFLVYVFVKAQLDRHNKIDLTDLVRDPTSGRVTPGRFWTLVGGAAGTFMFIFLGVSGHFDATYASFYLALMFGLKVAADITGRPVPGAVSEVTTTTTSTARAGSPLPDAPPIAAQAATDVEPLSPAIKPQDVGKSVALVGRKRKKRRKHVRS